MGCRETEARRVQEAGQKLRANIVLLTGAEQNQTSESFGAAQEPKTSITGKLRLLHGATYT